MVIKRLFFLMMVTVFFTLIQNQGGWAMKLTTQAYSEQGTIPIKYVMPGAGGKNVSIPFQWSDIPAGTKSLALTIIDPHKIANNWIHWMVINIPPDCTGLEEGASGSNMPSGSQELKNSFGQKGYGGPQPPAGTGEHPYVCTVCALDIEKLDLPNDASLEEFKQALEGHVLDKSEYTGIFEQK